MDPGWLSNAYVVADEPGGTAVFVDSGAPLEPLLRAVDEWQVTPTHVMRTHSHPDHVAHESELGVPVARESLETGDLWVEAIPTPGHSDDMVAFVVNDAAVFSGDTLFKDAIGGGDYEQVRAAVMDVYMPMPPGRRVLPGTAMAIGLVETPATRAPWYAINGPDAVITMPAMPARAAWSAK